MHLPDKAEKSRRQHQREQQVRKVQQGQRYGCHHKITPFTRHLEAIAKA
jgi:hypothetical protein